eukprot:TRINITY_DN2782_c0_g1_i1.p1 TRINITY_DN2782_c0_g1~~TRINITY_DN2782_c0_g1_i1.p1  ORF type:complete len:690 (+),score=207.88 TRINITY_DN2782_c0_g1_i1:47-2071(+)
MAKPQQRWTWTLPLLLSCSVQLLADAALLGGAPGHRVGLLRAHGQQRNAVAKKAANASDFAPQLNAAVDKLGGVLDAVSSSFATLKESLTAFDATCSSEATSSSARIGKATQALSELGETKLQQTATEAKLKAQLTGLTAEEEKAKANFDSTVERRASERQEYLDFKDTNEKQSAVLSQVIEKLEAKKLEMSGLSNSSNHEMDPGSGGASLDYVLGVFRSLKDSATQDSAEEATQAETTDTQLASLVSSYKETLQHVDTQYTTKEAERVAAEVAILRASEEAALQREVEEKETTIGQSLSTLCSARTGKVPGVVARGDQRLSELERHVNLALTTLTELGFGGAFLQKRARSPPLAASAASHAAAAAEAQERAANAAAALPAAALSAAEKVVPAAQLAILRADPAAEAESSSSSLSSDQQQCVNEKKRLTAEIIAARQAAHQARTKKAQADGRIESRKKQILLSQLEKAGVDGAKTSLEEKWPAVTASANGGPEAFDGVVADAETELAAVQTDVEGYAAEADAPPKAQALKVAVAACIKSLTGVKEVGTVSVPDAETAYTETLVTLSAVSGHFNDKVTTLSGAQAADETESTTQADNAAAAESQVTELTNQRTAEEQRCEPILQGTSGATTAAPSAPNLVLAAQSKVVVSKQDAAEAWAMAKKLLGKAFPELSAM